MRNRLRPAASPTPPPQAGGGPRLAAAAEPPRREPPPDSTAVGRARAAPGGPDSPGGDILGLGAGLPPPPSRAAPHPIWPMRPASGYSSLLAFLHDHGIASALDPAVVRETVDDLHRLALGSPEALSLALKRLDSPLRLVAMAHGAGSTSETLSHRVLRGPDPVGALAVLAPYRPFVNVIDDEGVAPLHLAIGWGERIPSAVAKAAYVRNAHDWLDLQVPNSSAATHIDNMEAARSFLASTGRAIDRAATRQLRMRQSRPSRAPRVRAMLELGGDCRLRLPFSLTPPPAAEAVVSLLATSPAGKFSPLSMAVLAADPPVVDLLLASLERPGQPRAFDAQVFGCDAVMADHAREIGSGDLNERVAAVHQALIRPLLAGVGDHPEALAALAFHLARRKDLPMLTQVIDAIERLPASDVRGVVNRCTARKPALLATSLAHCPDLALIERLVALGADVVAPVLERGNIVEAAPLHLVAGLRGEVGMHLVIMQCPEFRLTLASTAGEPAARVLAGAVKTLKGNRPVAVGLLRALVQAGADPCACLTFHASRLIDAFASGTSTTLPYRGPQRVQVSPLEACAATRSYEAVCYLLSLPAVRADGGVLDAAYNVALVCDDQPMAALLSPWLPAASGAVSRRPKRGGRAAGR